MNKKIFFLFLLLFTIFFDNYAFGVIILPSSGGNIDLIEKIEEDKGEEVIIKKCLKKEYLFLNNGKEHCVIKDVVNKREYVEKKMFPHLIILFISAVITFFIIK